MFNKRQLVERGVGYKIYFYKDTYFVDLGKNICNGYNTLEGAKEAFITLDGEKRKIKQITEGGGNTARI